MNVIEDKSWPSHNILAIGVPVITATIAAVMTTVLKSYVLAFCAVICGMVVLLIVVIAYLINAKVFLSTAINDYNNLNKKYEALYKKNEATQSKLTSIKEAEEKLNLKTLEQRAEINRLNDKIKNSIDPLKFTKERSEELLRQNFNSGKTTIPPNELEPRNN